MYRTRLVYYYFLHFVSIIRPVRRRAAAALVSRRFLFPAISSRRSAFSVMYIVHNNII